MNIYKNHNRKKLQRRIVDRVHKTLTVRKLIRIAESLEINWEDLFTKKNYDGQPYYEANKNFLKEENIIRANKKGENDGAAK